MMVEDAKTRALAAMGRRIAAEEKAQYPQIRDKRKRHEPSPNIDIEDPVFSRICQPVHENLLNAVEVANKDRSIVDKLLHDLVRKGDSAQKYIKGSSSLKFDCHIHLDNHVQENKTGVTRLRALQANSKRSKTRMSMKQLKKCGLLDLSVESQKFELFLPMHKMWQEYVMQLLKNVGKSQVAAVLFGANLHGAILRVVDCNVDSFTGVSGIMIRETAETFGIMGQDDKFRVVPKKNSVFMLQADCWKITLYGDKIRFKKARFMTASN